jgi:tripartite-type tricarboxylate transporter receptor subunit TctC
VRSGTLIALANTAEERLPDYPDLPTLKELGYPELVATTWFSISAPAKLPREIAEKVNHEMMRTMALPAVQQQMQRDGLITKNMTIEEFGKFIAFETTRWKPVIERAGLVGVKLE